MNNPLRLDPTRTTLLRKKFGVELTRGFKDLKKEIHRLIVDEDALGLSNIDLFTENVFCKTGKGGGIDPTCGSKDTTFLDGDGYSVTKSHTYDQWVFKNSNREEIGEIQLKRRSSKADADYVVANVLVWPKFQRKGWATKFYKEAANWVNQKGHKLYLSKNRSKDALKLHDHFKKLGVLSDDGEVNFSAYKESTTNAFCPTGKGGGIDPTCSPKKSSQEYLQTKVKQSHIRKVLSVLSEGLANRTGQDELDIYNDIKADPSDYEAVIAEMRILYDKADPHKWIPPYKNSHENLVRRKDESDTEFAERREAHGTATFFRGRVAKSMSDSELTLKQRNKYIKDFDSVLNNVLETGTLKTIQSMERNVHGVSWYKSIKSLNEHFALVDPQVAAMNAKGYTVAGAYDANSGFLTLDGLSKKSDHAAKGTYAHELGHSTDIAEDGYNRLSYEKDWLYAYHGEAKKISAYATTSSSEAYAEFSRYLWGNERKITIAQAKEELPQMTAVFQRLGLLKESD